MAQSRKTPKWQKPGQYALAERIGVFRTQLAKALPYFTRNGGDTEYLVSNPNGSPVGAQLYIFGKGCKIVKEIKFKLKPHCTRSIRIKNSSPNHAGHTILVSDKQVIAHLLYQTKPKFFVQGGELAGKDNLFQWGRNEKTRTYGFGYRSAALSDDQMHGSVFISNPNPSLLGGEIVYLNDQCGVAFRKGFRIQPGCTTEYPFPSGTYGYGRITVSNQAVINVLHFSRGIGGLSAAELVGESNLLDAPADLPQPRKKVLFDATHLCRPGIVGDWEEYKQALTGAGLTVTFHTTGAITLAVLKKHDVFMVAMARNSYTQSEKDAIVNYVNGGGSILIAQDFGGAPWSVPTREILNLFGASDENNTALDPSNHDNNNSTHIVFDAQRNFLAHPAVAGINDFVVSATSTLSSDSDWTTVVESDDDSDPARRPVLIARPFGQGRVLAIGDSNTWADHAINSRQNKKLGIDCAKWLLFHT